MSSRCQRPWSSIKRGPPPAVARRLVVEIFLLSKSKQPELGREKKTHLEKNRSSIHLETIKQPQKREKRTCLFCFERNTEKKCQGRVDTAPENSTKLSNGPQHVSRPGAQRSAGLGSRTRNRDGIINATEALPLSSTYLPLPGEREKERRERKAKGPSGVDSVLVQFRVFFSLLLLDLQTTKKRKRNLPPFFSVALSLLRHER